MSNHVEVCQNDVKVCTRLDTFDIGNRDPQLTGHLIRCRGNGFLGGVFISRETGPRVLCFPLSAQPKHTSRFVPRVLCFAVFAAVSWREKVSGVWCRHRRPGRDADKKEMVPRRPDNYKNGAPAAGQPGPGGSFPDK